MSRRHRPRHADDGATLILVLIIITVLATVMGVILSQEDTAIRSTVALRDQAADVYSADGATQAVLNGLKTSGINCGDPTNPTGVTLGSTSVPFYNPVSSEQGAINGYAQCTPDPVQGATTSTSTPPPVTSVSTVTPAPVTSTAVGLGAGDSTLPSYGVLTTGSSSGDFGFDISTSANNKTVCIENGSVGSNSKINASGETLAVRLTGTGSPSDCTTGTGVSTDGKSKLLVTSALATGCTGTFTPTPCTSGASTIATPTAPALPASVGTTNPSPTCSTQGGKTYAAFVPGYYTTAANLNDPCGVGSGVFEWLSPGTYIFNFSGTTTWSWPTTMVAGTPIKNNGAAVNGLDPTKPNTLSGLNQTANAPSACADPATTTGVSGVSLIFAGSSLAAAPSSSTSEICASSPTSSPPVAIYGLASAVTLGAVTLPAETMCGAGGCGSSTLITTDPSGQAQLYVRGYVYAPNAQLMMTLKNSIGQLFNWGIVIRNFQLTINGSSPTEPFVQLPKPNTGVGVTVTTSTPPPSPTTSISQPAPVVSTTYSIRYINVWTCTVSSLQASGQQTCPNTGTPNVQVRVLTDGSSMQVLSWNTLH
ncbi:MAG TPA: hypothetical protein VGH43_00490 [Jatrophihabitans sp.]